MSKTTKKPGTSRKAKSAATPEQMIAAMDSAAFPKPRRLSCTINGHAGWKLDELAEKHNITKAEALERMIAKAHRGPGLFGRLFGATAL